MAAGSSIAKKFKGLFSGITGNVWILGVVSMLTDVASEMIFAVLPVYLSSVLGLSTSVIGLIEGFAEASANISRMASGIVSDAIKKQKNVVIFGYALSSFSKPLFGFATSAPIMFIVRVADRVGKGIRDAPRDALIADSTKTKKRGAAFGLHRSMDKVGAVIGPLIAIVLLPLMAYNYRDFFLLSIIPGILSLAVLYFYIREPAKKRIEAAKVKDSKKMNLNWNLFHPQLTPEYRKALVIALVFALGNFSFVFLMLRLVDFGIAAALIPVAYLASNLVYMLSATPVGFLSDRIGRKSILAAGYAIFCILCILAAVGGGVEAGWLLILLYGLFTGTVETMQRAFVVDIVGKERRATALGTYFGTVGLLTFFASALAGLLWQYLGAWAAFGFAAAVSAVSLMMLLAWFPNGNSVTET
ncbi:MAG: MFS transporter [Candidatus Micrarchaeia archaeon]